MKIAIVHPAHYGLDKRLIQAKRWIDKLDAYIPHLGPALLAACTPEAHEVVLWDEYIEDIDFDAELDVVGISAQIMQFERARDISQRFRARGVKTVLGGFLPSLVPGMVREHFDAVVVGEGDEVWPEVLGDIERGQLKGLYQASRPVDLTSLPVPRYDLIARRRPVTVYPVQATRGCPYSCQYCSITAMFKGAFRKRPVDDVVRDIEATGAKNINFCDDNLCEDPHYAATLFDALRGSGPRWGTQTSINVAKHPTLLNKARQAGCNLMAVGIETLSTANLERVDKTFFSAERYADALERIRDAGISPHALIIFGLPDDTQETFVRTMDFLERLRIPVAQFFLFMPYPGTPAGNEIWANKQLSQDVLGQMREPNVILAPARLTAEELQSGWWSSLRRFYSPGSIVRRLLRPSLGPNLMVNLATNLLYWFKIRRGIHPVYFGM